MFENFTYKQKLIGLGVVLLLLFFTANKRSFKATKNAYQQMKEVEAKVSYLKDLSLGSKELQNQVALYNNLLGKQDIEASQVQQEILNFASKYAIVDIDQLKETHLSESNGFHIITNQLVLEGDFLSLLEVVYAFEKKFNTSILVSINFLKEKNYQRKKDKLKVQLIFQNYEKS
tara:strand:- start:36446 stop:36967 length:522 start_codon:yes stop_codon:yes gene_type:complete